MLTLLAKHAAFDLKVDVKGDLHVDQHHSVEDTGICLGQAIKQALGDKGRRPPLRSLHAPNGRDARDERARPGRGGYYLGVPGADPESKDRRLRQRAGSRDFWQAVAANVPGNLHVVLHHGRNSHPHRRGCLQSNRPRPCGWRSSPTVA